MIIIFSQKSRRIRKTIYLFWKKHQKIHNLYNSNKKGVTRTDKNKEEYIYIYIYLTDYNLLIMQDLQPAHYQILSILKEFIKCKCRQDDKKCETCRIKYKHCECFLEYKNLKDDLIEYKFLRFNKNYQEKCDGKLKEQFFLIHTNFLTMIISLFYCCEKLFTLMNIWMIQKN